MRTPALLVVSVFVLIGACAAAAPATRPNVVILLTDDQGTLDANCHGSTDIKTPNMDRLAAGGGRPAARRPQPVGVLASPAAPGVHEVLHFAWGKNWAVRPGDWKLIGTFDAKTNTTRHSLHNLAAPRPEERDHSRGQPQLVTELAALHEAWEQDVNSK